MSSGNCGTRFQAVVRMFDWEGEMTPSRSLNAAHRQAPTECQIAKDCPAPQVRQDRQLTPRHSARLDPSHPRWHSRSLPADSHQPVPLARPKYVLCHNFGHIMLPIRPLYASSDSDRRWHRDVRMLASQTRKRAGDLPNCVIEALWMPPCLARCGIEDRSDGATQTIVLWVP